MTTEKPKDTWSHKIVLGCTDDGQHRWTTLHTWQFRAGGAWSDDAAHWTPLLTTEVLEITCPRCGRSPRYSGRRPGPEGANWNLREVEQHQRRAQRIRRLDISRPEIQLILGELRLDNPHLPI